MNATHLCTHSCGSLAATRMEGASLSRLALVSQQTLLAKAAHAAGSMPAPSALVASVGYFHRRRWNFSLLLSHTASIAPGGALRLLWRQHAWEGRRCNVCCWTSALCFGTPAAKLALWRQFHQNPKRPCGEMRGLALLFAPE